MNAQVAATPARASKSTASWLPGLVWALSVALIATVAFVSFLNAPSTLLSDVFGALVWLAFATVGALIASRRPENLVGWLFAGGTCLNLLGQLALEYAVYTLHTAPHSLPGGEWTLWFGGWVRSLGFFILIAFVPLLFPNGKLPSRRWRPVAWFAVGEAVLFTLGTMFDPTNESELRLPPLPNPLGVKLAPDLYAPLVGISFLGAGAITVIVAASVVIRLRHAEGEERQQLKWFAYAGILAAIVFGVLLIGALLLPPAVMIKLGSLFPLGLVGFPIAAGIAILKYRLYEIDLLINRTLVYVPLTAILAGLFAASIALSQKLFIAVTGQSSDAATVLTTLVIVAAFTPLKDGLQALVDRRFKEPPDPAKKLKAYGNQVDAVVHVLRSDESTRRLLDEAMSAFDAKSGAVFLQRDTEMRLVQRYGDSSEPYRLTVQLESDGRRLGLISLGARRNGLEYAADERATVQQIANSVAAAIALTMIMDGDKE